MKNAALRLGADAAVRGFALDYVDSIGSTNTELLARARENRAHGPLWLVAGEQTAGKGRAGRAFVSPPGNLYASLLLDEPCTSHKAPELGFVAGVALARAARARLGDVAGLGLKWPNDLMHAGAKLSGMLLEATRLPSGLFVAVIGIGVNCRSHPQGLAYPATDLEAIRTGAGDPSELFAALSDEMARALDLWAGGDNFAAIREAWLGECLGRGGPIRVALGARTIEGVFDTIDANGRLVVLTGQGSAAIDAGDVWLGAPAGRPDSGA